MATASENPQEMDTASEQQPETRIIFKLPAGDQVSSLQEQAEFFLDKYWRGWRNDSNYIIPPNFTYMNPEVSDATFKMEAKKVIEQPSKEVAERVSDDAMRLVYDAIQQLIEEKIQAPFIAVQNLDLGLNPKQNNAPTDKPRPNTNPDQDQDQPSPAKRLNLQSIFPRLDLGLNSKQNNALTDKPRSTNRGQDPDQPKATKRLNLQSIFPQMSWEKFQRDILKADNAEFDYVLIGPKIGIIAIEVKSSYFTQRKHFESGIKLLPEEYKKGLVQVERAHALVHLLKVCAACVPDGLDFPGTCVRKILFTPNLERARYDKWLETLNENDRDYVEKQKVGEVTQWFKEDWSDKLKLCSTVLEDGHKIDQELYLAVGPILAAMASITTQFSTVELDTSKFSALEAAIAEDFARISTQNPIHGTKASKPRACAKWQPVSKSIKRWLKVYFLNPEQHNVLKCKEKRLFVTGPAGVGKTIVLQAKALELLNAGKSVRVLTSNGFHEKYIELFQSCDYRSYQGGREAKYNNWLSTNVMSYLKEALIDERYHEHSKERDQVIERNKPRSWTADHLALWHENILKKFDTPPDSLKYLGETDAIVIDDGYDDIRSISGDSETAFLTHLLAMAFFKKFYEDKVVWMAVDLIDEGPHFTLAERRSEKPPLLDILSELSNFPQQQFYHVATLRTVMRCSENIHNAYKSDIKLRDEITLGHKIQGFNVNRQTGHFTKSGEAISEMVSRIQVIISRAIEMGIKMSNIAVIYVGDYELDYDFGKYLERSINDYFKTIEGQLHDDRYRTTDAGRWPADNNNVLTIDTWNRVSSYEWPIVIYVKCWKQNANDKWKQHISYAQYRAKSRAVTMLYEISFTYDVK